MLFVNYKINASKEELLEALEDNDLIVGAERFDTSKGTPRIHIKHKDNKLKISCEFTGRATKDNGFLEGTYFKGKISEKDGTTALNGIIVTAPIYHSVIFLLFAFFVYQCIVSSGFSVVPLCLLAFSIFMFKDEFRKQSIIKKYIFRAFKITYSRRIQKQK